MIHYYFQNNTKNQFIQNYKNDNDNSQFTKQNAVVGRNHGNQNAHTPQEEANMLLMRKINIVKPSLDKFVKRISTKPEVESFIPKQKDIDLKAPILKSKGIIKRENKKENINK